MSCSLEVVTPDSESGDERSTRSETANGESSNGRRDDFESSNLGSSPSTPTKVDQLRRSEAPLLTDACVTALVSTTSSTASTYTT
jgi:hypothetical protein